MVVQLNHQITWMDEVIESATGADGDINRLKSVPYIGTIRAAAFVATIDDAERFTGAHQVESYLGLVPSELSSGDKQRRGRITKAGSGRVRWLLVEAAWSMLWSRKPEVASLREWGRRIAARRGHKVAVVALARRLAGIMYALMRDRASYEPARLTTSKEANAMAA
jgi:transposase